MNGPVLQDVICTKDTDMDPRTGLAWPEDERERAAAKESLAQAIRAVLEPRWYVPVVVPSADANTSLSSIGDVWSPEVSRDPRSPIVALAGPMHEEEARSLKAAWEKPARSSPRRAELRYRRRIDPERGVEQQGRVLASAHGIGWEEHWPFLNALCDLADPVRGMPLLEAHLQQHKYCGGADLSGTDIDALVAVQVCEPLRQALAGGEWGGASAFPAVWAWAKLVHAEVEKEKGEAANAVFVPGVSKADVVAARSEASVKRRLTSQLQESRLRDKEGRRLSHGHGSPLASPSVASEFEFERQASPLSPRHATSPRYGRTPMSGGRVGNLTPRVSNLARQRLGGQSPLCSPLATCSRINACGFSAVCRGCNKHASPRGGAGAGAGAPPRAPFSPAQRLDFTGSRLRNSPQRSTLGGAAAHAPNTPLQHRLLLQQHVGSGAGTPATHPSPGPAPTV